MSKNSAWAGRGAQGGAKTTAQRTFAQIVEDEKLTRNILEIQLDKITSEQNGVISKPKPLTFDDLGELIFDVLKLQPSQCLTFDYNRYDTKQIKLKPDVDASNPSKFITTSPITFKDHLISVRKQLSNVTRITFKSVPLNVPDEELLHLSL